MINEFNRYLYSNKWSIELEDLVKENHLSSIPAKVTIVEDGYILPCKLSNNRSWGLGGYSTMI